MRTRDSRRLGKLPTRRCPDARESIGTIRQPVDEPQRQTPYVGQGST